MQKNPPSQGNGAAAPSPPPVVDLESVVIRFAGDSGDGMQLTGTEFTRAVALGGRDIATFPDFPAEIRAGVFMCQIQDPDGNWIEIMQSS